jgi:type II secretory pathway component PulF
MMIVVGVIVLCIIASIMLPMVDLMDQMQRVG